MTRVIENYKKEFGNKNKRYPLWIMLDKYKKKRYFDMNLLFL